MNLVFHWDHSDCDGGRVQKKGTERMTGKRLLN